MTDELTNELLKRINSSNAPLETKELENSAMKRVKKATRIKVLGRLRRLWGEGKINGKQIGSGKGTWIWWK